MIRNKRKICYGCDKEKFIWATREGKKYCTDCWRILIAPEKANPSITYSPPKKIKQVSASRRQALERYRRLREKYFEEHPVCEFPGCSSTQISLHHKKGRIGAFLTDKRFFCSLCWPHHQWVETHPDEAKKLGLSLLRLTK